MAWINISMITYRENWNYLSKSTEFMFLLKPGIFLPHSISTSKDTKLVKSLQYSFQNRQEKTAQSQFLNSASISTKYDSIGSHTVQGPDPCLIFIVTW